MSADHVVGEQAVGLATADASAESVVHEVVVGAGIAAESSVWIGVGG